MAWTTTIKTWTSALVTVADLNTEIRDRMAYLFRPTDRRVRATRTSSQNISNETWTKVAIDTEQWDPSGWFDTSNNRFIPQGTATIYCHIIGQVFVPNTASRLQVALYKNGVLRPGAIVMADTGSSFDGALQVSDYVDFNGTTDYVELWVEHRAGSTRGCTGMLAACFIGGS
jgi:hypothetical protein